MTYDSVVIPVVTGNITTSKTQTISRVTMTNGSDIVYTAGDDTGMELKIPDNQYSTQAICDTLLSQLYGLEYAPYTITNAVYDPAAELGDGVYAGDKVRSIICEETARFDINYIVNVSAPGKDENDTEYPYETAVQKLTYQVADKVDGAEVESIIEQKADSIRLRADKISWESKYSSMSEDGILECTGAIINGKFRSIDIGYDPDYEETGVTYRFGVEVSEGSMRFLYNDTDIGYMSYFYSGFGSYDGISLQSSQHAINIQSGDGALELMPNGKLALNFDEILAPVTGYSYQSLFTGTIKYKNGRNVTTDLEVWNGLIVG